jgi:hypothetical protein
MTRRALPAMLAHIPMDSELDQPHLEADVNLALEVVP